MKSTASQHPAPSYRPVLPTGHSKLLRILLASVALGVLGCVSGSTRPSSGRTLESESQVVSRSPEDDEDDDIEDNARQREIERRQEREADRNIFGRDD